MRVWDLPTRLFHWSIVMLVAFSWWSAESGLMTWHYRSGISALILLIFRLLWGVVGSSTARFTNFIRSPKAVIAYLRSPKAREHAPGHNPLGGYSVIAMLAALCLQVGTGLFAVDVDGVESGPLSAKISFDLGRLSAQIHHISFNVLEVLVAAHLLAILWYRVRGRKLIMPMVTGYDPQVMVRPTELSGGGAVPFVLAALAAFIIGWWVSLGAPLGW